MLLIFTFISIALSPSAFAVDPYEREPYGSTQCTLQFSEWNLSDSYNNYPEDMSLSTYSSGVKVEILNVVTDNTDKKNYWIVRYKASGNISAYCSSYNSNYSAYARTTINGYTIEGNDYRDSGSHYTRQSVYYQDTEKTIRVHKGENRMKLEVIVTTYSRTYLKSTTRSDRKIFNMNSIPQLTSSINRNYMNGKDSPSITVTGKVWDMEQDAVTIEAKLGSVTKSKTINTPNTSMGNDIDYVFTFSFNEYPSDMTASLLVIVKDCYGDSSYKTFKMYIDRDEPTVSIPNDTMVKGGSSIHVTPSEQSDIYLLKNDTPYPLYPDILHAVNENKGIKIGNCSSKTDLTVPNTLDGTYRLFAVDNGKNVSSPSNNMIMVDSVNPQKTNVLIDGNTIKLIFNERLKPVVPSKDDFFIT